MRRRIMENVNKLVTAAKNKNTVNFTYKKKQKKNTIVSEVKDYKGMEVYEIKDGYLYAFDPVSGHIKKFFLHPEVDDDGILFVSVNEEETYEPRYEVKV